MNKNLKNVAVVVLLFAVVCCLNVGMNYQVFHDQFGFLHYANTFLIICFGVLILDAVKNK